MITSSSLAPNSVTSAKIQDGSVSEALLDPTVQTKLNAAPAWSDITGKPVVIAAGTSQAVARAAIGVDVPMRSLSASYRPLQGVHTGITSTITTGTDNSGGVTVIPWSNRAGKYRFVGMNPTPYPGVPSLAINDNAGIVSAGNSSFYNAITVEFWSNATDIRVHYFSVTRGDVWALVDDKRIVDGTYLHGNVADGDCTWKLTQSTAVWRKWRLSISTAITAITINPGSSIAETAKGFQLCIIGDSYVAGTIDIANAVSPGVSGIITAGAPIGEFEQETGIDVWRAGVRGSGYINNAGIGAMGPYGSTVRMNSLASLPQMDAIVVWSTPNDDANTPSAIAAAATDLWSSIAAARPSTPLIVTGLECAPNYPIVSSTWAPINAALKSAAENHAGVTAFVDFMEHGWMTGTGRDGAPAGDGNADFFMANDSTHLTHPGSRYWGQNVARIFGVIPLPFDKNGGSF